MKKKVLKKIIVVLFLIVPAKSFSQLLFSESFSTNTLPSGWTNDSLGLPAIHVWIFNNQYNRIITGAGFDTHFAIFDSDEGSHDDGIDELADLTTPDINIAAASGSLFLEVDQQYRGVPGTTGGTRVLEVSTNSGSTWTVVDSSQTDLGYPNPAAHSVYNISFAIPSSTLKIRFHYTGSWDWWWAIDNVNVISRQPCTNPVNAGTTQSSLISVCPTDSFYLYLSGADQSTGLSYQWQISPDFINWNNLSGDTLTNLTTIQSVQNYYRCGITCSGQTSYSTPVMVSMNPGTSCYCVPPFTFGCDILNKVVFNTISNVNSGCNGNPNNYINYGDTGTATTNVVAGNVYDLIIASGAGTGNHGAGVWFDFNHNGSFQDPGEFFHISDSIPELSSDFTTPILIPNTAIGTTRMRVRYIYNNAVTQTSDCASYSFGETEDYTVHISNNPIFVSEILSENVKISPTPATDRLRISTGNIKGSIKYILFDCTGRQSLETINSTSTKELNVGSFSRGIYFLRIETMYGAITKKIVLD